MSLSTKRPGVEANPATPPHVAVAWACGVLSAVVYGLTPTIAALSYETGLTPTMLVALRSLFGAAAILLFAWATGRIRRTSWRTPAKLMLVCGPLFGFQLLCYFAAVQSTGVQVAVVVVHVYPVFVLLMVWLTYRQRHSPLVIALCLVMIGGIGLVGWTGAADVKLAGIGLAVASALGYALYLVLGERWVQEVGAVVAGGLVTAGAGLTAGAVALVTWQSLAITSMGWVSVILQGVFMIPVGIGCAFYAVRRLGAVSLSLLGLLEPIVGVLAASLVLAESLMPGQWAGMAVILLACGVLPWATSTKRQTRTLSSASHSTACPIR
ncbi:MULTISPECIES: DMT family transporter [unclassified Rhodococcus (in: high G+C Gram-positive bacteria)]|uniref:DMT family transporter n=1 Tax=unclassified Rhodococcus (in: high G+C Gram-positive bacteria) TaxID=192944 RepID=UPI001FFA3C56|nr:MULTISPECIES: DMT family transporter [unclassified Rhodococcus (in: high G+C Gram-positive bacteria)]